MVRLETVRPVPEREVTWKQSCLLAVPNALRIGAIKAVEHAAVKISEKQTGKQVTSLTPSK